jgi:ribosome-binding protein aMBF1 (putative translation factor)
MGTKNVTLSASSRAVGARVRELRTGAERSQAWLARQMQDQGFPWYQATVHRIEAGERAALFKEAEALAQIFEVPLSSFSEEEAP